MKLEELGKLMAGLPHSQYGQFGNAEDVLDRVNQEVHKAAMAASGVRADQLADENLEGKPIVLLYWSTLSLMYTQVYIEAAKQQTYFKELG